MLKAHEFKELLGFNHTFLVLISVAITGVSFPYIFLSNELLDSHIQSHPFYIGWIYSAILHAANLSVFYFFKKHDQRRGVMSSLKLFFSRNFPVHLFVTASISFLMSVGVFGVFTEACPPDILLRNIIGTSILMSIIVGFYESAYYMNALNKAIHERETLKRENVQAQLDVLKSQVQPHFLFNSLNTLASLIPEEPGLAVEYVTKLSKVYRYILEIKDKKLISVQEEMGCLKAYLFMLETRFGENLNCNIQSDDLSSDYHIVPLSVQILIENAVKHNVVSQKKPLNIDVRMKGEFLKVTNNLQLKEQETSGTKTGLANIQSRYKLLGKNGFRTEETVSEFTVYLPLIGVV